MENSTINTPDNIRKLKNHYGSDIWLEFSGGANQAVAQMPGVFSSLMTNPQICVQNSDVYVAEQDTLYQNGQAFFTAQGPICSLSTDGIFLYYGTEEEGYPIYQMDPANPEESQSIANNSAAVTSMTLVNKSLFWMCTQNGELFSVEVSGFGNPLGPPQPLEGYNLPDAAGICGVANQLFSVQGSTLYTINTTDGSSTAVFELPGMLNTVALAGIYSVHNDPGQTGNLSKYIYLLDDDGTVRVLAFVKNATGEYFFDLQQVSDYQLEMGAICTANGYLYGFVNFEGDATVNQLNPVLNTRLYCASEVLNKVTVLPNDSFTLSEEGSGNLTSITTYTSSTAPEPDSVGTVVWKSASGEFNRSFWVNFPGQTDPSEIPAANPNNVDDPDALLLKMIDNDGPVGFGEVDMDPIIDQKYWHNPPH